MVSDCLVTMVHYHQEATGYCSLLVLGNSHNGEGVFSPTLQPRHWSSDYAAQFGHTILKYNKLRDLTV